MSRGEVRCWFCTRWRPGGEFVEVHVVRSSGLESNGAVCADCARRIKRYGVLEVMHEGERCYVSIETRRARAARRALGAM